MTELVYMNNLVSCYKFNKMVIWIWIINHFFYFVFDRSPLFGSAWAFQGWGISSVWGSTVVIIHQKRSFYSVNSVVMSFRLICSVKTEISKMDIKAVLCGLLSPQGWCWSHLHLLKIQLNSESQRMFCSLWFMVSFITVSQWNVGFPDFSDTTWKHLRSQVTQSHIHTPAGVMWATLSHLSLKVTMGLQLTSLDD